MQTFKKIVGWFVASMLIWLLPLVFALTTLDGTFCRYGNCIDVKPFWEVFWWTLLIDAGTVGFFVLIISVIHWITID